MFLQDEVVQAKPAQEVHSRSGRVVVPGAGSFARAICQAPARYVLSDEVRDQCLEIAAERSELLSTNQLGLRFPYEVQWVEWRDSLPPERNVGPLRCGALIRCSEGGRAGRMEFFWSGVSGADPAATPMSLRFDLDSVDPNGLALFDIAYPGGDGCGGRIRDLSQHCRYAVSAGWSKVLEVDPVTGLMPESHLIQMVRPIATDFALLLSFALLLGARGALEQRPTRLERLNRKRRSVGRAELLEHVELRMHLEARESARTARNGGGARAASRLHQVRGHLVQRAGKTFWRTTHLRGDAALGVVASRTVHVER